MNREQEDRATVAVQTCFFVISRGDLATTVGWGGGTHSYNIPVCIYQ